MRLRELTKLDGDGCTARPAIYSMCEGLLRLHLSRHMLHDASQGCLLSAETLPTMLATSLLYTTVTLVLAGQHVWYNRIKPRLKAWRAAAQPPPAGAPAAAAAERPGAEMLQPLLERAGGVAAEAAAARGQPSPAAAIAIIPLRPGELLQPLLKTQKL